MALSVPRGNYPGLKAITELDEKSVERLVGALAEAQPAAAPDKLASDVSDRLGEPPISGLRQIIWALVNLSTGRILLEMDLADFVSEVCEGLKEDRQRSECSDDDLVRLQERLERLLGGGGSIAITSKAQGILTDHEHIFVGARILTDVRTVFQKDASEPPAGAVIVHMLGVHYHEGATHKEIFFALNSDDLRKLSDSIERAKKKEANLKGLLSNAGVPNLGVE